MKGKLRHWMAASLFGLLAAGSLAATEVMAQYPEKPVRIVVPFPVGGPVDFIARELSKKASEGLGQPVVIENQAGAAGNIGTAAVGRAEPDGYTLLLTIDTPLTANPYAYGVETVNPAAVLEPVATVGKYSQVLVVHPKLNVRDFQAFRELSRRNDLSYSSSGVASPGHLQFELLRERAGVDALHIPYKGNAAAVQSLVAGEVDAGFLATSGALPHVRSGRLVALMVPGNQRDTAYPEVPSAIELGIENFDVDGVFALMAPRGVSMDVKDRWEQQVRELFNNSEFVAKLKNLSLRAEWADANATREWLDRTASHWREVIEKRGIRLQ